MSLKARIEAVIYAADEPVTLAQLSALFGAEWEPEISASTAEEPSAPEPASEGDTGQAKTDSTEKRRRRDGIQSVVNELIAEYDREGERGMEIREVAGGYRMSTRPEYHDAVRGFIKSLKPPLKLSLPALETLAVIAYKQPVTAPEIGEIRGVDSSGVLGSLLTRKLITTAGRKQVIGRPILYKTTRDFLLRFGLKDVNELPSLEEFEKMAAEVSEFEDAPASAQDALAFEQAEKSENETDAAPLSAETGSLNADDESPQQEYPAS